MNKKNTPQTGKIKVLIGSISLLTVFLTPYLNLTQFSISTSLLQNVFISLVFLSFWILAARLLHKPQQTNTIPKRNEQKYFKNKVKIPNI